METLTLKIKDQNKFSFLVQLVKQLDFVEIVKPHKNKKDQEYDFFKSAGLWEDREIDAKNLRERAWDRKA